MFMHTEAVPRYGEMARATDTEDPGERRYASIETADGDLVIYDYDRPTAWLQTDHAVEIRE